MLCVLAAAVGLGTRHASFAATPTVIYSTSFEVAENYNIDNDLVGQNGWVGFGTGGNGLVTNYFEGMGQQAYIGFSPPTDSSDSLTIWRPINFNPIPANKPIVTFSVLMMINDSSDTVNGPFDEFRWSIYNSAGNRLFTLIFDNHTWNIDYLLDEASPPFRSTGKKFQTFTIYRLVVGMDFQRNQWSAMLDNVPLVVDQPITTRGQALDFGDADAVWFIRTPGSPGDNFMVFDDYLVTAEEDFVPPPLLETVTRLGDGSMLLRLHGENNVSYAIEGTVNLSSWIPLKTNTPTDGTFEYLDTTAGQSPLKFYRARVVQ
ncbi:MAG: hypothetical protein AB1705_07850 [Verrucomicrobiota bacterium]